MQHGKQIDYKDAGVDLTAADNATKEIAKLAKSTFTPGVLTDIGLFGGFFSPDLSKYKNPVLVSSIDGVGTKLKIAIMTGVHSTIGQDLVNHCVDDIMTSGADPLFFLDYLSTGKLDPGIVTEIVAGMAKACKENACALIGGETAEMPGFYQVGDYDVAGCIVGIVEKQNVINGSKIGSGDILIGLTSNGLHTNGYSLARKVILDVAKLKLDEYFEELQATVGKSLLAVHKSYRKAIQTVRSIDGVVGISHITGGGIVGNTKRLLKNGLQLEIDWNSWEIQPIFNLIQRLGNIPDEEMRRVFNLGIGLVLVVKQEAVDICQKKLAAIGEKSLIIGRIKG